MAFQNLSFFFHKIEKTSCTLQLIWKLGSCIKYLTVPGVESVFLICFPHCTPAVPGPSPGPRLVLPPIPGSRVKPFLSHQASPRPSSTHPACGAGIRSTPKINPCRSQPSTGCCRNVGSSWHEGIMGSIFFRNGSASFCSLLFPTPLHSSQQLDLYCLRGRTGWLERRMTTGNNTSESRQCRFSRPAAQGIPKMGEKRAHPTVSSFHNPQERLRPS